MAIGGNSSVALDSLSVEQVAQLLKSLGMQIYIQVFLERAIDGST